MKDLQEAQRAVANAKLNEFRRQCQRLATLVRCGSLDKARAIDCLADIADANGLVVAHGEALIRTTLSEAFANADFRPMAAEVA
jgi:hypothetical protein